MKNQKRIRRRIILAVDVGGTTSKSSFMEDGKWIGQLFERPTIASKGPAYLASELIVGFTILLGKHGLNWEDVVGLAVALPAPVRNGVVMHESNLGSDSWNGANFKRILSAALSKEVGCSWNRPLVVGNDGYFSTRGVCAALGERAQKGVVLSFSVGSGVGGNEAFDGTCRDVCEPGNTVLSRGFRLEDRVSLLAIARKLPLLYKKGKLKRNHAIMVNGEEGESNHMLWLRRAKLVLGHASACVASGDEERQRDVTVAIMAEQAKFLGHYIAIIVSFTTPHTVVIGGGVVDPRAKVTTPKFRLWWMQELRRRIEERITIPFQKGFDLIESPIGDEAAAYGAALAVQALLK